MIEQDMRTTIYQLHKEGWSIRRISRELAVHRDTIKEIIAQEGCVPEKGRSDKIIIDSSLIQKLYKECDGWVQRVHEKLIEENGMKVGYSTLTRIIRQLGLGDSKKDRCAQVPDKPGAEMQHDTTVYTVKIGEKRVKVVASILYLRYCKMRYLKFYRSFNRFAMKCFFHEALTFFGYTARECIIDNTNLARLRGTGRNAIIVPEMEQFAKRYGFTFICHEVGHANRKAGNERSFYTVETNFLPGRTYENFENLNSQAFEWATVRMSNRAVSKSGLIPAQAFEYEKSALIKLPPHLPPPYRVHERGTDQYGYISFNGNYYWVPGSKREQMRVLEYSAGLKIYATRVLRAEYELPPFGVKNKKFFPKGMPKPKNQPVHRIKSTAEEEKRLRLLGEHINAYLDFVLKDKGGKQRHRFIRELFAVYHNLALPLFHKTITRALEYRITDMGSIERIALFYLREGDYETPFLEIDQEFQDREAYKEGRFSDPVDFSPYEKMLEEKE
jgi:hypothetical protein